MREERFKAYIKPQTAPALTFYKTQHGSQPNVNPLHPLLIPCGSVLHASELKHNVVAKKGVGVKENGSVDWDGDERWRGSRQGFAPGQWTPMMWERMCGLFPVTKAISPWKNFRGWCHLISRLGGMWAPVLGTKPSAVFCTVPQRKQQEWRGSKTGSSGKQAWNCCSVIHRREGWCETWEDSLWREVFIPRPREGGQETQD